MHNCCTNLQRAILAIALFGFTVATSAQTDTLRVVAYNIEADINGATMPNDGTDRVIEGLGEENYLGIERPLDILGLEETTSNAVTVAPLVNDLNTFYNGSAVYAQSPVQGTQSGSNADGNGPNAVIYNTKTLALVSSVGVGTPMGMSNGEFRQVMRYQFQPVNGTASNAFYVYVTHMKSSFSGDPFQNEVDRNAEAQIIRTDAARLATIANPNPSILYIGDFNLDGSARVSNGNFSVSAYQTMTNAGAGQAVDPLNANPQNNNETWTGNPAYVSEMTEADYYLYYRDDLQLMTQNVFNGTAQSGLKYIPGSLHPFGNNGSTPVGDYVFDSDNTALNDIDANSPISPAELGIDLYYASDHLPLVADYVLTVPEPNSSSLLVGAGALVCLSRLRRQWAGRGCCSNHFRSPW